MAISEEMKLALRRKMDAEDDFAGASDRLDEAQRQVQEQADKEQLLNREVEAMYDEMKEKGTDELLRDV